MTELKSLSAPVWGPDGQSLFTSVLAKDGKLHIWKVFINGKEPQELISDKYAIPQDISPDGKYLILVFHDGNSFNIGKMPINGGTVETLGQSDSWEGAPRCSPVENKIVFTSERGGSNDLFIMSMDGSNVTQLTASTGDEFGPKWSPDGKFIIFMREDSKSDLKAINMAAL